MNTQSPALDGHRPVRSFKRRASRVTSTQRAALDNHWQRLGLAVDGAPLDLAGLFGRSAPVVLEIGFGMGEATVLMAAGSTWTEHSAFEGLTRGAVEGAAILLCLAGLGRRLGLRAPN